jgi:predicted nucleic acid-binding protein
VSRIVVDASVAAKWFLNETHSPAAVRLVGEHDLLAPDLLLPELAQVIWKRTRRGELTGEQGIAILRQLNRAPLTIHSSALLIEIALEIALALARTVYDCLYLTLAIQQRCRLVTADRRFHQALQRGPFASHVLWVEDRIT